MSYLLDKKTKQKKFLRIGLAVVLLVVLFYFRSGIFGGLSSVAHVVFRPVLILGESIGEKIKNIGNFFASKNYLEDKIENLESKISEGEGRISNYNSILAENLSLKEILGRKNLKTEMILAAILAKPNQSPYDTLLIDIGVNEGVEKGDMVFALMDVPLGVVSEVYANTSKVILFSSAGVKTQAIIEKNIFVELVGRGGGNFEMILPRNFTPERGDEAVIPGIMPYALGVVETIISDPRDPFVKALLVSPVNIQELKFVQVERSRDQPR
ncbi:hypothetical protein HYZ82_03335 [Candidatus Nomurabacteria bacterium]|nr:hypothetical protein [Candidatus Nomurabacteria bacterium]